MFVLIFFCWHENQSESSTNHTKKNLFWVNAPLWCLECATNSKTWPQLKKITIRIFDIQHQFRNSTLCPNDMNQTLNIILESKKRVGKKIHVIWFTNKICIDTNFSANPMIPVISVKEHFQGEDNQKPI